MFRGLISRHYGPFFKVCTSIIDWKAVRKLPTFTQAFIKNQNHKELRQEVKGESSHATWKVINHFFVSLTKFLFYV